MAMHGDTRISSSSGKKVKWVFGEGGLGLLADRSSAPPRPIRFGRSSSSKDFGRLGSGDNRLKVNSSLTVEKLIFEIIHLKSISKIHLKTHSDRLSQGKLKT